MASRSQSISADRFVQLILKHEWRFRAFVATLLSTVHDIDEVVQNTLLVAWEKREQFQFTGDDPDEEFVRWVCTIARYQSLQSHQQQATSRLVFDDALIEQLVSFQFEESAYLEARHRALAACIDRLKGGDRDLLRGRYAGDCDVEQLAEKTGKSVSAIYKSLKRIRASLMTCIERTLRREGF